MPKVSVVIPTHNRAALLRRAIASVLNQTMDDFEIVVVDDASHDGTREMILSIGDRRIKYLRHNENMGVSSARNTAIASATGAYIGFLDDDDEWLPEKLHNQLDLMETVRSNVGAICCGNYEVESSTNRILAEIRPSLKGRIFEQLLTQGRYNRTSTVLVRASCFETVGLFDPLLRYGEDFDMWLRIAREYDFDCVATPLARVYLQPNGLSQNYDAIIAGAEALLHKYGEFFKQNPRVYSKGLHRLGTYYCFVGNVRRGRELFYSALAQDCLATKSYACIALSLLGARAFKGCYAAKDRLLGTVAPSWRRPDSITP